MLTRQASQSIDDLLRVSRFQANQLGLDGEDMEDCAIEFVEHMLLPRTRNRTQHLATPWTAAYVHRCARNHAIDYHRKLRRKCDRQVFSSGNDATPECDFDVDSSPDTALLYAEFWGIMRSSFGQLGDVAHDLVIQRYLHNKRIGTGLFDEQNRGFGRACSPTGTPPYSNGTGATGNHRIQFALLSGRSDAHSLSGTTAPSSNK